MSTATDRASRAARPALRGVAPIALAALAMLAVLAVPSTAAPRARLVGIGLGGTRAFTLSVPGGAVLAVDDVTIRTTGRHAAVFVHDPGSGAAIAVATSPRLGEGGSGRVAVGALRLAPRHATTYRVFVVTDRAAAVDLRFTNAPRTPELRRAARPPATAMLNEDLVTDAGAPAHLLPTELSARLPMPSGSRALTVVAVRYVAAVPSVPFGEIGVCTVPKAATERCPGEPDTFGRRPVAPPPELDLFFTGRGAPTTVLARYAGYSAPDSLRVVVLAVGV